MGADKVAVDMLGNDCITVILGVPEHGGVAQVTEWHPTPKDETEDR